MGVKRPGREADHSPPSSANVKEWVELYLHSPNTPSWHGAQLKKEGTGATLSLPFTMNKQFYYFCTNYFKKTARKQRAHSLMCSKKSGFSDFYSKNPPVRI